MQPPTSKTYMISNRMHTARGNGVGTLNGDRVDNQKQWSLISSGFPKDKAEAWAAMNHRNKLGSPSSSSASNALTQIYSPPSHVIPSTSEGIVVQALNVVSDQHTSSPTPPHRQMSTDFSTAKVAKKRRKQNGGVDVEHSKSNKEFLRKAQQALRDLQGGESEEEEGVVSSGGDPAVGMEAAPKTLSSVGPFPFSRESTSKDNSSYTREAASAESSNPYGYEDPDTAARPVQEQQRRFMARRRCSVTEYSLRAAQSAAAAAATEHLRRLQLRKNYSAASSKAATVAASTDLYADECQPSRSTLGQYANRTVPFGDSGASKGMSHPNTSTKNVSTSMMAPPVRTSSWQLSQPAPSQDPDTPTATNRSTVDTSESLGYEDMDMPSRETVPTLNSNPYGYGDYDASPAKGHTSQGYSFSYNRPQMGRAQRRGSVTKFSLDAAKAVASFDTRAAATNNVDATRNYTEANAVSNVPDTTAQQDQTPNRNEMPKLTAHSSGLSLSSISNGPSSVHVNRSLSGSLSFRGNGSTENQDDSSGEDDDDNHSTTPESDDESLGDSVTSITIPLKSEPDRAMNPPMRHDSVRSCLSRASTHSVQSMDSDGDSLAPDMRSLCSISFATQSGENGNCNDIMPNIPLYLPHTPTPRSQQKDVSILNSTTARCTIPGLSVDREVTRNDSGSLPVVAVAAEIEASPLASPKMLPLTYSLRTPSLRGGGGNARSLLRKKSSGLAGMNLQCDGLLAAGLPRDGAGK